jgi:23S rRNA G2445 N2-methylase RlmL
VQVLACDTDAGQLAMAKRNAEVYGVADKIVFLLGNVFDLAPKLHADVVFLSPPWGGPMARGAASFDANVEIPGHTWCVPCCMGYASISLSLLVMVREGCPGWKAAKRRGAVDQLSTA